MSNPPSSSICQLDVHTQVTMKSCLKNSGARISRILEWLREAELANTKTPVDWNLWKGNGNMCNSKPLKCGRGDGGGLLQQVAYPDWYSMACKSPVEECVMLTLNVPTPAAFLITFSLTSPSACSLIAEVENDGEKHVGLGLLHTNLLIWLWKRHCEDGKEHAFLRREMLPTNKCLLDTFPKGIILLGAGNTKVSNLISTLELKQKQKRYSSAWNQ